ncbi:hypothetical protein [Noviherbaspirillum sp. UKPF54]|uniref:hypothetical protein n=1 Tax=Noviherbaspirillum sp. UKPF54 TaxID=2601898 RepID=UPI0011B1138C|nr:hypothetical protein [Noviherbaspirillum sp. UKPF54]QDZ29409.1 hypothetical protein FAY22_16450 [Noviherbaspirillum sp. UKPF54]
MTSHDPDEINRLIGAFTDLQEQWENAPDAFDWSRLEALARDGAHAYNECCGPSFHALALDGVPHTEFHERFLAHSLRAGFDPFKLARAGNASEEIPVIDHASLADTALWNPSAARMRASLMELARQRFAPLADDIRRADPPSSHPLFMTVEACAESLPLDLLERISPELAREHHGDAREQSVDPIEGYLSAAEVIVESNTKPYG